MFAFISFDISREIFVIPILRLPLTWYGLFFAAGFWLGLYIFLYLFKKFLSENPLFGREDIDWKALSKNSAPLLKKIPLHDLEACNRLLEKDLNDPIFQVVPSKTTQKFLGSITEEKLRKRVLLEEKFPQVFIPLKMRAKIFGERMLLYILVATILGARLGHIIFYEDLLEYLYDPISILKTWEGGLASHGGVAAILVSIFLFYRKIKANYPTLSLLRLTDMIAVPTMLAATLIRIGNFFNQEILGTASNLPWAVIFMHPADGSGVFPRHPAQLYEAIFYFILFMILIVLSVKKRALQPGRIAGLALLSSFLFRFFIEFLKTGQSTWFDTSEHSMLMGQVLSIPLVIIGAYLLFRARFVRAEG